MMAFLFLYRFLFVIVSCLILWPLVLIFQLLKRFQIGGKFAKTILLRWNGLQDFKDFPTIQPHQKVYWFHAASGEIEYAKPVMRQLKERDPQCIIVWSYSSISALDFFSGVVDVDFKFPLPFDSVKNAKELISKIKPHLFCIARSDLWPELLWQLRQKNIPRFLFASTVSEGKSLSFVNQNVFSLLSHISCVAAEDQRNLRSMNLPAMIFQHGDPRADQVYHRATSTKKDFPLARCLKQANLLLLGSAWPEDEDALKPVFDLPTWSFILVPHEWHPEDRQHYLNFFTGKTVGFFSEIEPAGFVNHPLHDVIIVDRKGILAELYKVATTVFVGGSFKEKVHSVYEPLAWGKNVYVGPYYENNREAVQFSKLKIDQDSFVTVLQRGKQLCEILQNRTAKDFEKFQKPITETIHDQLGASKRIVDTLFQLPSMGSISNSKN